MEYLVGFSVILLVFWVAHSVPSAMPPCCEAYVPEEWRAADMCALPKVNPPKHVDSDLSPKVSQQ